MRRLTGSTAAVSPKRLVTATSSTSGFVAIVLREASPMPLL